MRGNSYFNFRALCHGKDQLPHSPSFKKVESCRKDGVLVMELTEYDIQSIPRGNIKSQVMDDIM